MTTARAPRRVLDVAGLRDRASRAASYLAGASLADAAPPGLDPVADVELLLGLVDKVTRRSIRARAFAVRGIVRFPWEMLAYDAAFPATESDARLMGDDTHRARTVRLYTTAGRPPSARRWASFLWSARELPADWYPGLPVAPWDDKG